MDRSFPRTPVTAPATRHSPSRAASLQLISRPGTPLPSKHSVNTSSNAPDCSAERTDRNLAAVPTTVSSSIPCRLKAGMQRVFAQRDARLRQDRRRQRGDRCSGARVWRCCRSDRRSEADQVGFVSGTRRFRWCPGCPDRSRCPGRVASCRPPRCNQRTRPGQCVPVGCIPRDLAGGVPWLLGGGIVVAGEGEGEGDTVAVPRVLQRLALLRVRVEAVGVQRHPVAS
jgi:hypothetical protein